VSRDDDCMLDFWNAFNAQEIIVDVVLNDESSEINNAAQNDC
jgi:hypothetical protein